MIDEYDNKWIGTSNGVAVFNEGGVVSVDESKTIRDATPYNYLLYQNYPNPFNPSTKIKFSIPDQSYVAIKVFDVLGGEVATLINEEKPVGSYEVEFNASRLPSGIYFYRLQANEFAQVKKMILLK